MKQLVIKHYRLAIQMITITIKILITKVKIF